jgi:hypothetical protein
MEDFVPTLDAFNVGKAEQDELLNNLRPMRAEIVEVDSPQVGTRCPPRAHQHRRCEPRQPVATSLSKEGS